MLGMAKENYCIIIMGPTGVGKTKFAHTLASMVDGEIINSDVGQFYLPLTIGTAKPDWRTAPIAHHLFDSIATPTLFSAMSFRTKVKELCRTIWQRNKIPIIVGGSSYYNAALFFPPASHATSIKKHTYDPAKNWWQELYAIDPERAREIDPHDRYRIERALDIWQSTGIKPSAYKPVYDPIAPSIVVWLERDRSDLYERINNRVIEMIDAGWIEEVRGLLDTPWESFLVRKKFIGYPEVIAYVRGMMTKEALMATIQKKTRHYAKRQMTFWRMLCGKINDSMATSESEIPVELIQVNLTHEPIDRYIKHLALLMRKRLHE